MKSIEIHRISGGGAGGGRAHPAALVGLAPHTEPPRALTVSRLEEAAEKPRNPSEIHQNPLKSHLKVAKSYKK